MLYHLMNKDTIVATFQERPTIGDTSYQFVEQYDEYMPFDFLTADDWIDGRKIAKHRESIEQLLRQLGLTDRHSFIGTIRCLSLTDTFWMKPADENLTWDDVSLYRNPFNDVVARIAFDGTGMFDRENSPTSPEFATSGSFPKCWIRSDDGNIYLVKRGGEKAANVGLEPYSEALASNLLAAADVFHVPYGLIQYRNKLASLCPLFTSEEYGFVPAYRFFKARVNVEDMLELAITYGAEDDFRAMMVMDAVMLNVDRHNGNWGFLVDNDTGDIHRMAPLFDHNYALLARMMQTDNPDEYLEKIGPRVGNDFVDVARELLTSELRATLISLKDFSFENPGHGFPQWRIDVLNRVKERQINAILGSGPLISIDSPTRTATFMRHDLTDDNQYGPGWPQL